MQNQKVLEQLGYSPKEAKVYLASLSLGEAHISDIATKVKMPRSSTQTIVDKLHEDGLMNFYVMRRYKYWAAEKPEQLLKNLQEREETIREAIPALTSIRKAGRKKQRNKSIIEGLGPIRLVADAAAQPILITNSDVEIIYVNFFWEEQFGYSLDEVHGKNPRIFKSDKTPNDVYMRMWKTFESHKLFQSDKIIDKKSDGTYFNLLTTIFQLQYGERIFYIQVLDDITEKKRVQALHKSFMHVTTNPKIKKNLKHN